MFGKEPVDSRNISFSVYSSGEARESVMMKLEQLIFFEEIEGTDEICLQ